tara:strand:- start:983 stop:1834 length:852 start_codon:yes stop_codon:yes gene_type:complete
MRIYIVIPCHNEAEFIGQTLTSLVEQTKTATKIVVVNDQSTDDSAKIVSAFAKAHPYISLVNTTSSSAHLPGSKVIQAFQKGYETLDDAYDILCKFDADLIFPANYLETIAHHFELDLKIGMVGGFCYVEKNGGWSLENLTNKDHIRGALKAYRKACFLAIGGLKPAMGWDTIDELLAQYHGWQIKTDEQLHVKHLKPTGITYNKSAKWKQGEAFYGMRYGFTLTVIAALKLSVKKKSLGFFFDYIRGFIRAKRNKKPYLISTDEGAFVRAYRWKGIRSKIGM